MDDLQQVRNALADVRTMRTFGTVRSVTGLSVRFAIPSVRVGDLVYVHRPGGRRLPCEIVGFANQEAIGMPLGSLVGVGPGDEVHSSGERFQVRVSEALLGRVVDGLGRIKDGGDEPLDGVLVDVDRAPPDALSRRPIDRPIATGVKVLDGLLTLGEGQRIGLFAGSGVGKSTLLGSIARGVDADIVIVALVGERGREVGEFLEHTLGEEGRKKSIMVVATSDASALERLRAAQVATAYAEHFRDRGKRVMLLVDSITRFARAQREIGLAAGEPPARRGYPPSVFALLPRLLERSGQGPTGSITAIYTVLVEGGDMEEPIADEVRGILDGHVVLDRTIADRGQYPAVDVMASLSRVMGMVVSPEHAAVAAKLRSILGTYEASREMIALGEYTKNVNPRLDEAVAKLGGIENFLRQDSRAKSGFAATAAAMARAVQ